MVTDKQAYALWPHWEHGSRLRFVTEVLDRKDVEHTIEYTREEFLLMGVERWLAGVCPQFDEAKRFHICKALRNDDKQFKRHAAELSKEGEIVGFHLSIFNDRWVSWDRARHLVDAMTYQRVEALPNPHVWVTILGVTPLYFRLLVDLERIEDDDGLLPHPDVPPSEPEEPAAEGDPE